MSTGRSTRRSPYCNTTYNDSDSVSSVSDYNEQTFGSLEDQPLVLPDASSVAATASIASSRGVAVNQRRQFAVDIQASGGIDNPNFSFATLAASKISFFTVLPTARNVASLKICSSAGRRPSNKNTTTLLSALQQARRLHSPSPQQQPLPQQQHRSPSPQQQSRPFVPHPSIMSSTLNQTLRGYLAKAEPITVNSSLVEKNKPFRIVKRGEYKNKDGLVVNVYIITLADLDPRWMKRDPPPFEIWHMLGTNECLAKVPAFDYAYLYDQASEEAGKQAAKLTDQGDLDAINIARNQVLANPERHFECYRLIFPEILNNEIFSPNALEGKVKAKLYPVNGKWNSTFKATDGSLSTTQQESLRLQIEWKIAVHENQKRSASTYKPTTNELVNQAESFFGKISLIGTGSAPSKAQSVAPPPAAPTRPPPTRPPTRPPPTPPSTMVLHAAKKKEEGIDSGAYAIHLKKQTESQDRGRENRITTTESMRKMRREKKLQSHRFPPKQSHLQDEAAGLVEFGGKVVVDAQGNTVSYARLREMVEQYAQQYGLTFDEAHAHLDSTYNVHDFAKSFTELLRNPSEAWRTQEEQIEFSKEQIDGWHFDNEGKGHEGTGEDVGMLDSDEMK